MDKATEIKTTRIRRDIESAKKDLFKRYLPSKSYRGTWDQYNDLKNRFIADNPEVDYETIEDFSRELAKTLRL